MSYIVEKLFHTAGFPFRHETRRPAKRILTAEECNAAINATCEADKARPAWAGEQNFWTHVKIILWPCGETAQEIRAEVAMKRL